MVKALLWDDLAKVDALRLFDEYVGGHQRRVDDLVIQITADGISTDLLDFSRDSLIVVWQWWYERHRLPDQPTRVSSDTAVAEGWPQWVSFNPTFAWDLGFELSHTCSRIGAYVAEAFIRHQPGSTWVVGNDRNYEGFNQPRLQIPGRIAFNADGLFGTCLKALKGERSGNVRNNVPDRMADWFDTVIAPRPAADRAPDKAADRFEITTLESGVFLVQLDDELAHDERGVKRLLRGLRGQPAIGKVIHEDREVIIVHSSALSEPQLATLLDANMR